MVNTVVFTNMNAKGNLFDKTRVRTMERIVGDHGQVIRTHSIDDLEKALYDLPKLNPESITLDGGDGTQLTFFTLLVKYWPKEKPLPDMGIISGGTWNVLAKHVGIKTRKWKKYLADIIQAEDDQISTQDIGLMKVSDDEGRETYGFSYGMGMPVTLLDEYYTAKRWKAAKLALMMGQLIGSAAKDGEFYKMFADKQDCKVSNGDGKEKDANLLGLMAQTVPGIGLPKSHLFYRATNTDKFHVLGTYHDILELLPLAPALYLGKLKLLNEEGFIDIQTDHYNVRSLDKPFRYQVNGDLSFMGDDFLAYRVMLEHGRRIHVIKDLS